MAAEERVGPGEQLSDDGIRRNDGAVVIKVMRLRRDHGEDDIYTDFTT